MTRVAHNPVVFSRSLCAEDVRRLSRVENWRGVFAIVVQWVLIAAAAAAAIWSGHWLVYLLAIVVIGTRQHALAILAHDAAHHRLFTNRTLNDLIAELTLTWPIAASLKRYRPFHLEHHRYSYTDAERDPETHYIRGDPDLHWPKSPRDAARIFLKDLLGLNMLAAWRFMRYFSPWFVFFGGSEGEDKLEPGERVLLLASVACVVLLLALTNGWLQFLLLWAVPLVTVATAVFRMRTIAEHMGLAHDHELRSTRTVLPSLVERFLIAPCNVHYHLEHHLYPSVPFYNLPKLHRRLLDEPEFRTNAHLTRRYTDPERGVIHEVTLRR